MSGPSHQPWEKRPRLRTREFPVWSALIDSVNLSQPPPNHQLRTRHPPRSARVPGRPTPSSGQNDTCTTDVAGGEEGDCEGWAGPDQRGHILQGQPVSLSPRQNSGHSGEGLACVTLSTQLSCPPRYNPFSSCSRTSHQAVPRTVTLRHPRRGLSETCPAGHREASTFWCQTNLEHTWGPVCDPGSAAAGCLSRKCQLRRPLHPTARPAPWSGQDPGPWTAVGSACTRDSRNASGCCGRRAPSTAQAAAAGR